MTSTVASMTTRSSRPSFPIRFEHERTRELLRLIAERQQTSMNQLAEEMIERELDVLALGLEVTMSRTIELLRGYRGELGQGVVGRLCRGGGLARTGPHSSYRDRPGSLRGRARVRGQHLTNGCPAWNEDHPADLPRIIANIAALWPTVQADARRRTVPSLDLVLEWHRRIYDGVSVPDRRLCRRLPR